MSEVLWGLIGTAIGMILVTLIHYLRYRYQERKR